MTDGNRMERYQTVGKNSYKVRKTEESLQR